MNVGTVHLADAATAALGPTPLVVDLDGTLIRTDLLFESALKQARQAPHRVLAWPVWLARGKAQLKRGIATDTELDVPSLPYDDSLVDWLRTERAAGRHIVLCTASDETYAQAVALHLGLFDEVIASDGVENVAGRRKAERLVSRFGEHGFDYVGNSRDDLPVWRRARQAIVVNAPKAVRAAAALGGNVVREFPAPPGRLSTWLRAMRLHQWLKNLLVLLPLAGNFGLGNSALVAQALQGFLAFGLCASSVYILNDLMDLESDRAHPRKRRRPFAAGQISIPLGLGFAVLLLASAAGLALATGRPHFMAWLAVYFSLTLAYTFFLKSRVIVDCIALGALYTLRIVAGWSVVGLPASFWLLAFSLFLFLSLAFLKRYAELLLVTRAGKTDTPGRGYLASDLPVVQSMGISSGFGAVLLLALYINGDTVFKLYRTPELLWLTIPILLYWVSRMWMHAQRGNMHDDPLVFAVTDRYSLVCGVLFVATLLVAH
jgi:4-hydroxybenzoate polyprenyltransferase/phosphoserine phosphatase